MEIKTIANTYDIPLVTLGGRDNDGNVLIFFMEYLPIEREEIMVWFLNSFKEFVVTPPSLLCSDQDGANLRAVILCFPNTLSNWTCGI